MDPVRPEQAPSVFLIGEEKELTEDDSSMLGLGFYKIAIADGVDDALKPKFAWVFAAGRPRVAGAIL
ncbi:MAG: hypothetical protein ACLPXB_02450 [Thiobacillaceae bacterium]